MRSGFDRIGYGGLILTILVPGALYLLIRYGTAAYCVREEDRLTSRRNLLAGVPAMETAGREARQTLAGFRRGAPGDPGGTEELGRWLRDVGKHQGVEPRELAISKDPGADPLVPSLRATFHADAHIGRLLLFLHELQDDPRLVSFEALHLRRADHPPGHYSAQMLLQAHAVAVSAAAGP